MALYRPDYKLKEAKELVETMIGSQGELVRYYVNYLKSVNQDCYKTIAEMSDVFNGIKKFTSKRPG